MTDRRKALAQGTVLIDKDKRIYTMGKVIGRGGSCLVYEAWEKGSDLGIVIKEVFPNVKGIYRATDGVKLIWESDAKKMIELAEDSAEEERMIASRIMKGNSHAVALYKQLNKVKVRINKRFKKFRRVNQSFFISVSLSETGVRLDELVLQQKGEMQLLDCIALFKKCLVAIGEIHCRGYIHLDISASNLYLSGCNQLIKDWGTCIAIDFGNTREVDKFGKAVWKNKKRSHSRGFGSPELRKGQYSLITRKADIYSLGVLFYYILYSGTVLKDGVKAYITGVRADYLGASHCVKSINRILRKATSIDLTERYKCIGELFHDINNLEDEVVCPEELLAPIDVTRDFGNREKELDIFLAKLEKRHLLHIWGESGMGKTTFAAMLLERYKAKNPKAKVLFVRYKGNSTGESDRGDYSGLKEAISSLLSNKDSSRKNQGTNSDVQSEERFQRNIEILNRYTEKDILYIDNFYSEKQESITKLCEAEGMYYRLIERLPMKLVISTRYICAEDERLHPLAQNELDATFFNKNLLSLVSEEKRSRFYRLLGWNTYLIQLAMSSTLIYSAYSFDTLLQRLSEREIGFEVDTYKDGVYATAQFQELLETVWNVLSLSIEEQTVLYICAVIIPDEGIDAEIIDRLFHESEYAKTITQIIKKNWVIWSETEKRYIIHDMARMLAQKYVDKEDKVWEFLWEIAERGETLDCGPMFAYADINKRIKSGIYHFGNGDYKRGYHCFYNCLSTMKTIDEEIVLLALDGITRCLEHVEAKRNEKFVDLCREQIVQGLNSKNMWGNILMKSRSNIHVDEAYDRCMSALCDLLIKKYRFDRKEDWNDSKREDYLYSYIHCAINRGWRDICALLDYYSYILILNYEKEAFKREFIKRTQTGYSHVTQMLIDIVWSSVPLRNELCDSSNDRHNRYVDKIEYMSRVKNEFRENRYARWIFKDSVMGVIDYLSSRIYSALTGELPLENVCKEAEEIIQELKIVDSLMMHKIYLYYGVLLAKKGEWKNAYYYYCDSACSYEPSTDKRLEELFFRKLSEVCYADNYLESAVHYQRLALRLYIEHYDEYVFDTNREGLGSVCEGSIGKYSRDQLQKKLDESEIFVQKNELEAAYCAGKYCSMNLSEEYYFLFHSEFEGNKYLNCRDEDLTNDEAFQAVLAGETLSSVMDHYSEESEKSDVLPMGNNSAEFYGSVYEMKRAVMVQEDVLALKKKSLGEEHPETLKSMYILAESFNNIGDRTKAQEIYEELLELKTRLLGEEHDETRSLMESLAYIYLDDGELLKAQLLLERLLKINRYKLGDDDLETQSITACLASVYYAGDAMQKSIEMREELLRIKTLKYGNSHPITLGAMESLAHSYIRVDGLMEKAIETYEYVLKLSKQTYGDMYPSTIKVMSNLADAYSEIGEKQKAHELYEQAYVRINQVREEGHEEVLHMMLNLANSYHDIGENDKARALFKMSMESIRHYFGESSLRMFLSVKDYARFCYEIGEKKEALASYGVAFKIGECIFGRDSLRVGFLINKMAEIRFDLRDDPEFRITEDEKVSFDFDDEEWNFEIDDEEE